MPHFEQKLLARNTEGKELSTVVRVITARSHCGLQVRLSGSSHAAGKLNELESHKLNWTQVYTQTFARMIMTSDKERDELSTAAS
jgi:hypothetical protein